jgi:hypothetical protein
MRALEDHGHVDTKIYTWDFPDPLFGMRSVATADYSNFTGEEDWRQTCRPELLPRTRERDMVHSLFTQGARIVANELWGFDIRSWTCPSGSGGGITLIIAKNRIFNGETE